MSTHDLTTPDRQPRRRRLVAVALAAGLVLAACDAGEDTAEHAADDAIEQPNDGSTEHDDAAAGEPDEATSDAAAEGGAADDGAAPDAPLAAPSPGVGDPAPGDDTAAPASGVTVTGAGAVGGQPDVVRLTAGVEVERDEVQDAIDEANTATQDVLDALDQHGIADEDVQTRDIAIHPAHGPEGTTEGYHVRNMVEVTIRDVDALGDVVQEVTDAGGDATRLHGVGFDLEEDRDLLDAAREAAIEDATEQAQRYAELADRELGELVAIEDRTVAQPSAGSLGADADIVDDAAAEAAGPPVEAGEQEVTVRVITRWTLD